jgi:hypothetical protein
MNRHAFTQIRPSGAISPKEMVAAGPSALLQRR